jgi:ribosomal protein L37AE/L43A
MSTWSNKLVCPKCGSTDTIDTVRLEQCNRCGWFQYYSDAYTPSDSPNSNTDEE